MQKLALAFQLGQEALLMAMSPWTFLFNPIFAPRLQDTPIGPRKPKVLIVDTWLHKSPLHWFWRWYLQQKGVDAAIVYFPLADMSFAQSAAALREHFRRNDLRDVVIVAISSGALTSGIFLRDLGGWDRVRQVITIGAPFKGTNAAVLVYFNPHLRALIPNSAFMWQLEHQPISNPERIVCLSATFDELVPRWSSCLTPAICQVLPVAGHDKLHSLSKVTYDRVIELVRQSSATPAI
ncbi:MAG: esterase/lipase family protein [Chloroflexota bacterium]